MAEGGGKYLAPIQTLVSLQKVLLPFGEGDVGSYKAFHKQAPNADQTSITTECGLTEKRSRSAGVQRHISSSVRRGLPRGAAGWTPASGWARASLEGSGKGRVLNQGRSVGGAGRAVEPHGLVREVGSLTVV